MQQIFDVLAPLVLLIALGSALAHIKFLGEAFIADLNKLAFWIALPALIFTSASGGGGSDAQKWRLVAVLFVATILISLLAWLISAALRLPPASRGTFVQAAFRGNLAYIGLPVLANSFSLLAPAADRTIMGTAVLAMVLTMAFYNILAVIVLSLSQHAARRLSVAQVAKSIATNPLLLAGLVGLLVPLLGVRLPLFLDRALQSLGAAAIPLALLCIGGSLVMVPLRGRRAAIVVAALIKVVLLPVLVFYLCRFAGLGAEERRIALIFACCPTAAASFVMARQMGGDEALASGSIALSTVLSAFSLAFVLWLGS